MQTTGRATRQSSDPPLRKKEFLIAALDQYERKLMSYASRLCAGNQEAARDAVQHTFFKLCQQPIKTVEPKLAPWLYRVCRNRVLDELKRKQRWGGEASDSTGSEPLDPRAQDPAERAARIEMLRTLRVLMDQLPTAEREVVDLWSHGFATSEIAEILSKQSGTVRVCLHRAIKRLRNEPELASWLERATGQSAEPSKRHGEGGASRHPDSTVASSNGSPIPRTSMTGDRL